MEYLLNLRMVLQTKTDSNFCFECAVGFAFLLLIWPAVFIGFAFCEKLQIQLHPGIDGNQRRDCKIVLESKFHVSKIIVYIAFCVEVFVFSKMLVFCVAVCEWSKMKAKSSSPLLNEVFLKVPVLS